MRDLHQHLRDIMLSLLSIYLSDSYTHSLAGWSSAHTLSHHTPTHITLTRAHSNSSLPLCICSRSHCNGRTSSKSFSAATRAALSLMSTFPPDFKTKILHVHVQKPFMLTRILPLHSELTTLTKHTLSFCPLITPCILTFPQLSLTSGWFHEGVDFIIGLILENTVIRLNLISGWGQHWMPEHQLVLAVFVYDVC